MWIIFFLLYFTAAIFVIGMIAILFLAAFVAVASILNPNAAKLALEMLKGNYEMELGRYVFTEYDAKVKKQTYWWYIQYGTGDWVKVGEISEGLFFLASDYGLRKANKLANKLERREPETDLGL